MQADAADVALDVTNVLFADWNVGTAKHVSADLSLSGDKSSNYELSAGTASSKAEITARPVTGSVTATGKVYDGLTAASANGSLANGDVLSGDTVGVTVLTADFADKNVGTGKTVTATLQLIGLDKGNYSLRSATATTTANITAKSVQAGYAAEDKVYDGTTAAVLKDLGLDDVIDGDSAQLHIADPVFNDKNVGTGKAVTGTMTLGGGDAGNYAISNTPAVTASITAAPLGAAFAASNKVYDATAAATGTISRTSGTVYGDDAVSITAAASFADKNVGTAKPVTVAFALDGADKGNYSVNASGASSANITAKALIGTITVGEKVYDGSTSASVTTGQTGKITGDTVNVDANGAAFASKDVGTHDVTASLSLSGTDAGNYTVNSSASTTGTITAKALAATFTASNKEYDGTRTAKILTSTLGAGVVTGEAVTLDSSAATATFADALVGTAKTVTAAGFALAGTDKGNYSLNVGTTTADITAWKFSGLRQPVDGSGVLNRAKAGSAIPVKFSLAGNKGLNIFAAGSPSTKQISCLSSAVVDDIELTVTANASGLQYDAAADQYNYVWKTASTWAGTCRQLTVSFKDGTITTANFTFTK